MEGDFTTLRRLLATSLRPKLLLPPVGSDLIRQRGVRGQVSAIILAIKSQATWRKASAEFMSLKTLLVPRQNPLGTAHTRDRKLPSPGILCIT